VFAPFALVSWYPTTESAKVVAYDATTGAVLWETTTPAARLRAMTRELSIGAQIADGCGDSPSVTVRINPADGHVIGIGPRRDEFGPYVPGGPYEMDGPAVDGLRWDVANERIVSDRGWSVKAGPHPGDVPALVTPEVVYLGVQGLNYLSCSN